MVQELVGVGREGCLRVERAQRVLEARFADGRERGADVVFDRDDLGRDLVMIGRVRPRIVARDVVRGVLLVSVPSRAGVFGGGQSHRSDLLAADHTGSAGFAYTFLAATSSFSLAGSCDGSGMFGVCVGVAYA